MDGIDFDALLERSGVLISIEETMVRYPGEDAPCLEKVKFVLDTIPNGDQVMTGFILNMKNEPMTRNVLYPARIDEFFALKSYMVRNGLVKH